MVLGFLIKGAILRSFIENILELFELSNLNQQAFGVADIVHSWNCPT
jgi:hypothetical protein